MVFMKHITEKNMPMCMKNLRKNLKLVNFEN
jgi:hypothetical protein